MPGRGHPQGFVGESARYTSWDPGFSKNFQGIDGGYKAYAMSLRYELRAPKALARHLTYHALTRRAMRACPARRAAARRAKAGTRNPEPRTLNLCHHLDALFIFRYYPSVIFHFQIAHNHLPNQPIN